MGGAAERLFAVAQALAPLDSRAVPANIEGMSLPPGFLDELRNRVSISQVVGRKVVWDMRKSNQGKGDWWAPCPFHHEKSASFHVDDRKGYYYCFGCHAKGDALSFVRETENVGFMEAVEILAREAGMPMPARDPVAEKKADRRSGLAAVMEEAVKFFRMSLSTQGGTAARDYLARRRLSADALARFEIGFAPDGWQGLWEALRAKGIAEDLILGAGLAKASTKGKAGGALDSTEPFALAYNTGGQSVYRARFGGFSDQEEAVRACRALKQNGVSCWASLQ